MKVLVLLFRRYLAKTINWSLVMSTWIVSFIITFDSSGNLAISYFLQASLNSQPEDREKYYWLLRKVFLAGFYQFTLISHLLVWKTCNWSLAICTCCISLLSSYWQV